MFRAGQLKCETHLFRKRAGKPSDPIVKKLKHKLKIMIVIFLCSLGPIRILAVQK